MMKRVSDFGVALIFLMTSSAWADTTVTNYSVPVPTDLAAYASFSIEGAQWTATSQGQQLKYRLPEDLVGGKQIEVQLLGAAPVLGEGFSAFSGDLARASCTLSSATHVLCMIQYKAALFGPDPAAFSTEAKQFLRSKYSGADGLEMRLKVYGLFQNEPAGVLDLK